MFFNTGANMIDQHLAEYKAQRTQLERQIIAVDGAIQALERLQREYAAEEGEGVEDGRQNTD